ERRWESAGPDAGPSGQIIIRHSNVATTSEEGASMLTANYVGAATIDIREAEPTAPPPGQVQIEVAYTGLCGTDLHILHGSMDARVQTPLIFGHEMSGTIAALGEGVAGWSVGAAVTVMPLAWDDSCPACREGNQHICQNLDFIG